jgi:hypothetical protein
MVTFNPSGVDGVVWLVSVGFIPRLRDYSRGGPLRGHIHLTFYPLDLCVVQPTTGRRCRFSNAFPIARGFRRFLQPSPDR